MVATLLLATFRTRKKSGTPIRAPPPKQMSCRLVRLKQTRDLTAFRSLGMGTYAIIITSVHEKTPFHLERRFSVIGFLLSAIV